MRRLKTWISVDELPDHEGSKADHGDNREADKSPPIRRPVMLSSKMSRTNLEGAKINDEQDLGR